MKNADEPAFNRQTKREYLTAKSLPRIEVMSYASEYDDVEVAQRAAKIAMITADAILAEVEKTNEL